MLISYFFLKPNLNLDFFFDIFDVTDCVGDGGDFAAGALAGGTLGGVRAR